jgi:hypothetical protein
MKDSLIEDLARIAAVGWIPSARDGNAGGVGNTLETLLGIKENNLPIPNAAEWELKCQRVTKGGKSKSYTTLFHSEPSPTALKFVPKILLPLFGWAHKAAGGRYGAREMSFRQTIGGTGRTDRGFGLQLDRGARKLLVSFDSAAPDPRHREWLEYVERGAGLGELNPQPYWGFDDLEHLAGTKLLNCFYVTASAQKFGGKEYFWYHTVRMLAGFSIARFLDAIEAGEILVDFDARSGHNHGTKFRARQGILPKLYEQCVEVVKAGGTPPDPIGASGSAATMPVETHPA